MIDALIRCADMAEYDAVREAYGLHDGNSFPNRVYTVSGTTLDDDDGNTVETREYLPYIYVWASTPLVDPAIAADPRCMIVADSSKFERGEDFIIQTAIPKEYLSLYFVETSRMTTQYPFGTSWS